MPNAPLEDHVGSHTLRTAQGYYELGMISDCQIYPQMQYQQDILTLHPYNSTLILCCLMFKQVKYQL